MKSSHLPQASTFSFYFILLQQATKVTRYEVYKWESHKDNIYIIFCKRVISLSRDICEKYGSICICMYSCHLFICSWMVVHVWEQSSYIEEVDNQDFVTNFIVFNLWEKLTEHIHFDLNERIIVTPTPSFNM